MNFDDPAAQRSDFSQNVTPNVTLKSVRRVVSLNECEPDMKRELLVPLKHLIRRPTNTRNMRDMLRGCEEKQVTMLHLFPSGKVNM